MKLFYFSIILCFILNAAMSSPVLGLFKKYTPEMKIMLKAIKELLIDEHNPCVIMNKIVSPDFEESRDKNAVRRFAIIIGSDLYYQFASSRSRAEMKRDSRFGEEVRLLKLKLQLLVNSFVNGYTDVILKYGSEKLKLETVEGYVPGRGCLSVLDGQKLNSLARISNEVRVMPVVRLCQCFSLVVLTSSLSLVCFACL
jgi:hypothetical protein